MRLRAGGFLLLLDRSRAGGRGRSCSINASGMPALRFPMTHPRAPLPTARGARGDGRRMPKFRRSGGLGPVPSGER